MSLCVCAQRKLLSFDLEACKTPVPDLQSCSSPMVLLEEARELHPFLYLGGMLGWGGTQASSEGWAGTAGLCGSLSACAS